MADLSSLEGISEARNDLYNRLDAGELSEARASQMERVLRGQESLKAHVPIRLLNVMTKMKGTSAEQYVAPLVKGLLKFTTGAKELGA
jgi:hypothetical protein